MAKNAGMSANNARFTSYPFDLWKGTMNDLLHRRLRAIGSHVREHEVVLDVGCNSGYLPEFVPTTCSVHGVDLSPAMVEIAKSRLVSAQVAPAESLPFPDKSFDVVVCAGVIEYVFDPQAVMAELSRVAKRAVIGTADHESGIWGTHRVKDHDFMVRSYNRRTLTSLLNTVGSVDHLYIVNDEQDRPQHYIFEVGLGAK